MGVQVKAPADLPRHAASLCTADIAMLSAILGPPDCLVPGRLAACISVTLHISFVLVLV